MCSAVVAGQTMGKVAGTDPHDDGQGHAHAKGYVGCHAVVPTARYRSGGPPRRAPTRGTRRCCHHPDDDVHPSGVAVKPTSLTETSVTIA